MKVAIINQHPNDIVGGSEIQCDIIAYELTKYGHEVCYFALGGNKNEYNLSYSVIPTKKHPKMISQEVIKFRPDIIYWRYNKNHFYKTAKAFKRASIPILFAVSHVNDIMKWREFGGRSKSNSLIRHFFLNLKRILIGRYNHLGFYFVDGISVLNKNYLGKVKSVSHQAYIPNSMGLEASDFEWHKPFICWVANLKPQKRPEVCIEVAHSVKSLGVDVIIVGKIQDKMYDFFKKNAGLPSNLHYLGPMTVPEVNGILKKSLFLFHTCKPEGFGNNFIQAWLQGKPTVSLEFDPGGLISSNSLGFVSNNDLSTFTNDIKNLVTDSALREKLGKNAQAYAIKQHHPETNVRKLERFIYHIIQ